jgi:hypothetical protein
MEVQHETQGRSSPTGRAGFSSAAAAAKHSLVRSRSDQDVALIARGSPASEPEMESATARTAEAEVEATTQAILMISELAAEVAEMKKLQLQSLQLQRRDEEVSALQRSLSEAKTKGEEDASQLSAELEAARQEILSRTQEMVVLEDRHRAQQTAAEDDLRHEGMEMAATLQATSMALEQQRMQAAEYANTIDRLKDQVRASAAESLEALKRPVAEEVADEVARDSVADALAVATEAAVVEDALLEVMSSTAPAVLWPSEEEEEEEEDDDDDEECDEDAPSVETEATMDPRVDKIFAAYDHDFDGWIRHSDVSRLEFDTAGEPVDSAAWQGLCELLDADPSQGWQQHHLNRLYTMDGGAEELERVWTAVCSRSIQRLYRGHRSRSEVHKMRASADSMAADRMYDNMAAAAVQIQRQFRGVHARRQVVDLQRTTAQQEAAAATQIQQSYRSAMQRRVSYRSEQEETTAAASCIQSRYRGGKARQQLQEDAEAAATYGTAAEAASAAAVDAALAAGLAAVDWSTHEGPLYAKLKPALDEAGLEWAEVRPALFQLISTQHELAAVTTNPAVFIDGLSFGAADLRPGSGNFGAVTDSARPEESAATGVADRHELSAVSVVEGEAELMLSSQLEEGLEDFLGQKPAARNGPALRYKSL